MDDVEKAILYTFDQSGRLDPSLKKAASAFADALKLRPDAWQLFLERFGATSYTEVQFWCLQGLHDFLRENYVSLPPEQRLTLKSALATWLLELSGNSRVLPSFAKNKLAQCLVVIVHFEFPDEWPTFFTDLITLAGQGPSAVDMFCRILTTVSEDIISLEIPRTQEDLRLSMHIKDSMRELCISQVAEAWFNLTVEYQHKDPTLAACVLRTMHLYINWIDIGLVANDRFVPMLFQLLSSGIDADLRGAAAECLAETLSKRMDPVAKLALIEKLNVIPMCTQWRDGFPSHGDEDLALNYARLLGVVAMELVESWKKVENPLISMKTLGFDVDEEASSEAIKASRSAARLLDLLFPALLMALHHPVDDVVLTTVPFFNAYLSRLKNVQRRTGAVPEASQNHVRNMLTGLAAGARYSDKAEVCAPSSAAANSINSDDEEDNMHTRRRELFLVFKNTSKLLPQVAIDMVGQKLQTVLAQAQPLLPDVEVAVTLLYELGEAALDEVNRPAAGAIGPMVLALMQADVPFSKHRIVAMPLLNTYVRYSKVLAVQEGQVLIPEVLRTFLDERGVGHPSRDVSTRACYLLSRFVKSLRPNLRSCAGLILQQLQPHLMTILKTPITDSPHQHLKGTVGSRSAAAAAVIDKGSCVDDRLYAFDAVGLLLGQVELPEADQATALKAEMALCMEQIQANLALASTPQALLLKPTPAALMQQALDALARLSKGISQNLATNQRPAVGQLFMEALELALVVPAAMPGNRALLQRFMSFLHCMVETVGTLTLPVLPRALELLRLPECDIPELCEAITVVNQLMLRFQSRLAPLLHQVTPVVVVRMHSLLRDDWDWSSKSIVPGGSPRAAAATPRGSAAATAGVGVTEDLRQRGELQKGYYSFLAAVTANELTPVLFAQPQHVLNAIVEALMKGASLHVDATTRKTCIQVLGKMLERGSSDEQLKTFMMERLGGEVCVAAVLGPGSTLDPRDGATYSLLMDIGLVLKALHAACGDRFISFLQEQVFPCLSQVGPGASQAAAEHSGVANGLWVSEMGNSLVQAIREGTADSVKKCMHVIMQQQRRAALQQQQQQQQQP